MARQSTFVEPGRPAPVRIRRGWKLLVPVLFVFSLHSCLDWDGQVITAPGEPANSMGGGADLPDLPTLQSSGGVLDVTLTMAQATVQIGGQPVLSTVFNGMYIAPTLRVRRGDILRMRLVNASGMNTNLHVHGMEVSPKGIADNIFRHGAPGATLEYEFHIPADHPAGLFWYHPHFHGNASAQTKLGLAGMIVVEGLQDEVPALQGLAERMLVLRDAQIVGGEVDTELDIGLMSTRTVNGEINPTIRIAPGETQLWRIGNQSANMYFRLVLDGHQIHQVGRDGNRLNYVVSQNELFVPPGGRAEVLVQAGATESGSFSLRTLPVQTGRAGDTYGGAVLATLLVEGTPVQPMALSSVTMSSLPDLRARVTNGRAIVFGQSPVKPEQFMINGQRFDMNQINTRVKIGHVERWTIRNVTNEWHAFHIHQTQFQVIEVDGKPVPFDGYYDVINVREKGSVTVIIPFDDPRTAGKYVYHCHILDHEDRGMMALIQVGPEDPESTTHAASMHDHGSL